MSKFTKIVVNTIIAILLIVVVVLIYDKCNQTPKRTGVPMNTEINPN